MVDWNSPTQLARDAQAFSNLIHVIFGLYLWEFCISFHFDLSFITRKRKFRWPLIFYFTGRYAMLAGLIGTVFSLNARSELNCQALYIFNLCAVNTAVGMASVNLSIRTMVVWRNKWYIIGPLVAISLGHWSLLLQGVFLTVKWIPDEGCVITSTNNKLLSATLIYSMSFDLIVLLLTASKLVHSSSPRSRLVHMMFADGLYYFIITFLGHLIATVFMTLDLNAIMSVIANGPAVVTATIASTRVVRHLANFSANVETFSSRAKGSSSQQILGQSFAKPHTSVHVQMDTLTQPTTDGAKERVVKVGGLACGLDSEAQKISNEFKHEHYPS